MNTCQKILEDSSQDRQVPRAKEPRVVVIREEFIALTGNPLIAAVLNQLVYWSGRVANVELFLREEREAHPKCRSSLHHGWFYKTSSALIEETMLCVKPATLRRYLTYLEERGWIDTRINPHNRWDRTTQYRVNLRKLCRDLKGKGYALPGFLKHELLPNAQNESFDATEIANSNGKKQKLETQKKDPSKEKKTTPRIEKNVDCNTETTTETTNKEHSPDAQAREDSKFSGFLENGHSEPIAQSMVNAWQRLIRNEKLHPTKKRSHLLESALHLHFGNNLKQWEDFCLRIKLSSFLMGEGPRKWRATLDWILDEANLIKVLEGNFDDPEMAVVFADNSVFYAENAQKKQAVLSSIVDPIWHEWCSQLAIGVRLNEGHMLHEPLSLFELRQIANAHFIKCEDNRLIWIGSQDPEVLKAIENLRLKITWVFAKEYPRARTFRTRLETQSRPRPYHQSSITGAAHA
jgi:hypothetical protein